MATKKMMCGGSTKKYAMGGAPVASARPAPVTAQAGPKPGMGAAPPRPSMGGRPGFGRDMGHSDMGRHMGREMGRDMGRPGMGRRPELGTPQTIKPGVGMDIPPQRPIMEPLVNPGVAQLPASFPETQQAASKSAQMPNMSLSPQAAAALQAYATNPGGMNTNQTLAAARAMAQLSSAIPNQAPSQTATQFQPIQQIQALQSAAPSQAQMAALQAAPMSQSASQAQQALQARQLNDAYNQMTNFRGFKKGGKIASEKKMIGKEIAFMKQKGAPKSMIKHEKAEAKSMGVKAYAKGGSVRGGGCESKGRTKGRFV